jgi:antitoxin HicB
MANLRKIRLELELDELTGVYTVTSPDVPGLVTEGSTPQEILANVEEAIECLLEGWAKYGIELPEALRQEVGGMASITVQALVTV